MLPLERFAKIRAAIERTGDRDRVLADAAMSPRAWLRHQRYWLGRIAAEIRRGEHTLSDAFLDAFLAHPDAPRAHAEAPVQPASTESVSTVARHVPSYMVGRAPTAPVPEPAVQVAAAPSAPTPSAPLPTAPGRLAATAMAMAVPGSAGPALPFASGGGLDRGRVGSAAVASAPVGSGTAFAPSDAGRAPATPFDAEMGPGGIALGRYVELVAALQSQPSEEPAILAGAELDAASFARVREHFDKRFSASARVALEFARLMELERKRPTGAARAAPRRTPSGTVDMPAAPALPSPAFPDLTAEQYAWVAATLRRTPPEQLELVLAKLRLTPASRSELEAHWRARMAADAELQTTFLAALARNLAERP